MFTHDIFPILAVFYGFTRAFALGSDTQWQSQQEHHRLAFEIRADGRYSRALLRTAATAQAPDVPHPGEAPNLTQDVRISGIKPMTKQLRDGDAVSLRAVTGMHVDVENTSVKIRGQLHDGWDAFILEKVDSQTGREIRAGDYVTLRAHNGMVLAVNGSEVRAAVDTLGARQQQLLIDKAEGDQDIRSGDSILLRTHNGLRLHVDEDSVRALRRSRKKLDAFVIDKRRFCTEIACPPQFLLRPDAGKILVVDQIETHVCCDRRASCVTHQCPDGLIRSRNASQLLCAGASCTNSTEDSAMCCVPGYECRDYRCPDGSLPKGGEISANAGCYLAEVPTDGCSSLCCRTPPEAKAIARARAKKVAETLAYQESKLSGGAAEP